MLLALPMLVRPSDGASCHGISDRREDDKRRRNLERFLHKRYEGGAEAGIGDEQDGVREAARAVRQQLVDRKTGEAGTMADDDLDLDAMLDSALDEGFADPGAAQQAGGEDEGEIDLDAMLDEAMVASVLDDGDGAAAAGKSRYLVTSLALCRISCLPPRDAAVNSIVHNSAIGDWLCCCDGHRVVPSPFLPPLSLTQTSDINIMSCPT